MTLDLALLIILVFALGFYLGVMSYPTLLRWVSKETRN